MRAWNLYTRRRDSA